MDEELKDKNIKNRSGMDFQRGSMNKEAVAERLRAEGYKITKQREILLDIILSEECSNCKEIYYKAIHKDKKIGIATIYRMLSAMESVGALVRGNAYKFPDEYIIEKREMYQVEFSDGSQFPVSGVQLSRIISKGLVEYGCDKDTGIKAIRSLPPLK